MYPHPAGVTIPSGKSKLPNKSLNCRTHHRRECGLIVKMAHRLRKRAAAMSVPKSAFIQSQVRAAQVQSDSEEISDQISADLQKQGFSVFKPSTKAAVTLAVAAKALQGYMQLCSTQPAMARCAGYTEFPCKQRLEYQAGSPAPQGVVLLQHVLNDVRCHGTCCDKAAALY